MMAKAVLSKHKRAKQWSVFSRLWHLYDATWQNPFDSAELIAKYLSGKHKPIFHTLSDCGDHVVVINTEKIAMPGTEWRYRMYRHHTMYAQGETFTPAWELQNRDATKVMWKAVYKACGTTLLRHTRLQRLHLFADDKIPEDIKVNICSQIRQLRPVPKRLSEYSQEELDQFPKLFDWPESYSKQ
ncbi:39S ribosomal protein L13, mitochondrial-like [Uloborus diversus]|uniref:39S ribosomal protein L13, mitochondrial-like n=1 Tax=Uloborus diversus TaxID=327109 RepID=UPI00240A079F|nr:39S ribosomal protein L13, mitochondrial-like [Uloborus diversus]